MELSDESIMVSITAVGMALNSDRVFQRISQLFLVEGNQLGPDERVDTEGLCYILYCCGRKSYRVVTDNGMPTRIKGKCPAKP
jgi:hypothetical protein